MLLQIKELELHPVDFAEAFPPGMIDFGPDLRQKSALLTQGRAQLIEERHGRHESLKDIRIAGHLTTTVELDCARCLEPATQKVARDFDLLYRPQGSDAGKSEVSVTVAEAEVGYYEGEGLQLEEVLREQVLLDLPLKAICRDGCKGLCPHCGVNLNNGECSCGEPLDDPRWAALKDLRSKL